MESETSPFQTYSVFGMRVRSQIPIPASVIDDGTDCDAEISYGQCPRELSDPADQGVLFSSAPNELLLHIERVGRFYIQDGRKITVERNPLATDLEVRVFLLGSGFGTLLHQREYLVLHGSTIQIGEACVSFIGMSGAGKSTMAAYMKRAGHVCLGDDLCAIRFHEGVPNLYAGLARMRLWGDAIDSLEITRDEDLRVRPTLEKYELHQPCDMQPQRDCRLNVIYHLVGHENDEPAKIEPLAVTDATQIVLEHTYRREYLKGMGLSVQHFESCVRLLQQVPVFSLTRKWDLDSCDEIVRMVERHVSEEVL